MSDSSSSEEEFLPLGIGTLSISPKATKSAVMVRNKEEDDHDLPVALRYHTLLDRAMTILKTSRDESVEKLKLPLSVVRRSRKTYVNVLTLAQILHRQTEQLSSYIIKNLYTTGAVNKDGVLTLDGSYLQSEVERILRQFIDRFVACKTCENVEDTSIIRDNKLFFLFCEKCKARWCIGASIEGFTPRVKKESKVKRDE